MAFYEVDGVHYEIPTDDPEIAKQKIRQHLGLSAPQQTDTMTKLGRTAAGFADTAAGLVSGTVGAIAYPFARAGRSAPEAERIVQENITGPMAQPFGRAFGVTQTPEYRGEATQRAMAAVAPYVEKGVSTVAEQTGLPKQDVQSYLETLSLGAARPVSRATQQVLAPIAGAELATTGAIAKGAQQAAQATKQTGSEFLRGATAVGRGETAFTPVDPTRINELVRSGDIGAVAGTMINRRGTLVNEGQMARAAGESIAEGYARNPIMTTLGDIAPTIAGAAMGVPIPPGILSAARGASPAIGLAATRKVRALPEMPEGIKVDNKLMIDPNIPATTGGLTQADLTGFEGLRVKPDFDPNIVESLFNKPIGAGGMAVAPTPKQPVLDLFNQKRTQFPNYDEKALIDTTVNEYAKELRNLDPNLSARAAKTQASKEFVLAREQQKKIDAERVRQEREQQRLIEEEQKKLEREQFQQNLVGPVVPEGIQLKDIAKEQRDAKVKELVEKLKKPQSSTAPVASVTVEPAPVMPEVTTTPVAPSAITPTTSTTPIGGKASTDLKSLKEKLMEETPSARLFEEESTPGEVTVKVERPAEDFINKPVSSIEEYNRQELFRKNPRLMHPDNPFLDPKITERLRGKGNLSQMIVPEEAPLPFKQRLESLDVENEMMRGLKQGTNYSYRKGDTIVTEDPLGRIKIETDRGSYQVLRDSPETGFKHERVLMSNGSLVDKTLNGPNTYIQISDGKTLYTFKDGKLTDIQDEISGEMFAPTKEDIKSNTFTVKDFEKIKKTVVGE